MSFENRRTDEPTKRGNALAFRVALDKVECVLLCAGRFAEEGDLRNLSDVDFDGGLAAIRAAYAAMGEEADAGRRTSDVGRETLGEVVACMRMPVEGPETWDREDVGSVLRKYAKRVEEAEPWWPTGVEKEDGRTET